MNIQNDGRIGGLTHPIGVDYERLRTALDRLKKLVRSRQERRSNPK
jgi:hypothetical protein